MIIEDTYVAAAGVRRMLALVLLTVGREKTVFLEVGRHGWLILKLAELMRVHLAEQ